MSNILIVTGHDYLTSMTNSSSSAIERSEPGILEQFNQHFAGAMNWGAANFEGSIGRVECFRSSLLDEFKEEITHYRFLLIFESPETVFSNIYRAYGGDLATVKTALKAWAAENREIFDFFGRNREISALVNASSVYERLPEFRDVCRSLLLRDFELTPAIKFSGDPIIEAMAAQFIEGFCEYRELYDYLQLAATLPGEDLEYSRNAFARGKYLSIQAAKSLLGNRALGDQLNDLVSNYKNLQEEYELSKLNLLRLQAEFEEKNLELEQQIKKVEVVHEKNLGLEDECDHFQLQLHKIQEEFEDKARQVDQKVQEVEASRQRNIALEEERKFFHLQLHQLQEEYEEKLRQIDAQIQEVEESRLKVQEKNEELEAEREFSTLQVQQLQEELDHYYLSYEELKAKQEKRCGQMIKGSPEVKSRSADFASAERLSILGSYKENGYQDIHLKLSNFILADGRCFEELTCKLAIKGGAPALELRGHDKVSQSAISVWPPNMQDEYGSYLLLLPDAEGEHRLQQQKMLANLKSTDRSVVFALVNVLRDHLLLGTVGGFEKFCPEEIRMWRTAAINLAHQACELNTFISLDEVDLKEDMEVDGYSHLWFAIRNLQFRKRLYTQYEFKLAALAEENGWKMLLEFRTLNDGLAPMEAWPPEGVDEHGHKLIVGIENSAKRTVVTLSEEVSQSDQVMLSEVIRVLPSLVRSLADAGVKSKKGWAFWRDLVTNLDKTPTFFRANDETFFRRAIARIQR